MKNNTKILCTLGTKTINKKFLSFLNNKVSLVRINLSHVKIKDLKRNIVLNELNMSTVKFELWRLLVRYVAPVAVTLIFINGLM